LSIELELNYDFQDTVTYEVFRKYMLVYYYIFYKNKLQSDILTEQNKKRKILKEKVFKSNKVKDYNVISSLYKSYIKGLKLEKLKYKKNTIKKNKNKIIRLKIKQKIMSL